MSYNNEEDWVPAAIYFIVIVVLALVGIYYVAKPV
jgi:hypothetical protein